MQPTNTRKRRSSSGVVKRAQVAVALIVSISFFSFSRAIDFKNLFAGYFPPILGYVLGLILGAAISIVLIRYLPRVVAILVDVVLLFIAIELTDSASSNGALLACFASMIGLIIGVPIAISIGFKSEEESVEQARLALALQSKNENSLVSWWRDGRMEFENSVATPADLRMLLQGLNGKKRTRFSAFNKGARIDVFGGPKQGYVLFYTEDSTLPAENQQWIQLLDDPAANAILVDANGQQRKAHKKSKNTARTYPGFMPAVFGEEMLNSFESVAEVVDRFAVGAPIQSGKKWSEGQEAYSARPFAPAKTASDTTSQPINNG